MRPLQNGVIRAAGETVRKELHDTREEMIPLSEMSRKVICGESKKTIGKSSDEQGQEHILG